MALAAGALLSPGPILAYGTLGGSGLDTVLTMVASNPPSMCLNVDVVTAATISVSITPNGGTAVKLLASKALAAGDHLIVDGIQLGIGDVLQVQSNQTDTTYFVMASAANVPSVEVTSSTGAVKTSVGTDTIAATYYFTGTPAATNQAFFLAPFACTLKNVSEVHSTAAGGTSTLAVTHETGTTAPGSGTDTLSADFNLNATANTPQNGTLVAAQQPFVAGDRLSVKFNNAIQSSAGVLVTAIFSIP